MSTSRPTIIAASERGVASAVGDRGDGLPASKHRDAVGHGLDLVQLVRDEDDRAAVGRHRTDRLEERVGLVRRQHGGRLVEDEDAGVLVERLQDLDALLLADRELPDTRTWVDGEPKPA